MKRVLLTILVSAMVVGCNSVTTDMGEENFPVSNPVSTSASFEVEWCFTEKLTETFCLTDSLARFGENAETSLSRLDEQHEDLSIGISSSEFGSFVDSVNGYEPDTNSEYWQFLVNSAVSQVGISDLIIAPDDRLEFTLVTF